MNLVLKETPPIAASPREIVSEGLVTHLDAAFESESSTHWNDQSGNENHFAKSGNIAWEPENGGRFNFNGGNFNFVHPDGIRGNNGFGTFDHQSFTIEAWIQYNPYGNYSTPYVWSYDWSSHTSPHYVQSMLVGNYANTAWGVRRAASTPADTSSGNTWYHWVGTRDQANNQGVAYQNGIVVGMNDPTGSYVSDNMPYTNQEVWIGRGNYDTGYFWYSSRWKGYMAIIRFYSRALSAEEVMQNFNIQKNRFGL